MVPLRDAFSFDALLQRIHPAESRIRRLAAETSSLLIIFDLLVDSTGHSLVDRPLQERRLALENFIRRYCRGAPLIRLSPATTRLADAKRWLERVGATLDGIIAKRRDFAYASGDRSGMQKIKNYRSADCVVGGFRYNEGAPLAGSLLLGLYDDDGLLHHVGFTSTIRQREKPALTKKLEALIAPASFTGNTPGGPSRWSTKRSGEWQPVRPKLVVEVCYDHFTGERFRHGTRLYALAARQISPPVHVRSGQAKKSQSDGAAEMTARASRGGLDRACIAADILYTISIGRDRTPPTQ